MDSEASSSFESSEILATFLASTPLISESWRLCSLANSTAPEGFVIEQKGKVGCVAFSGIQMVVAGTDPSWGNLVPLETAGNGLFDVLKCHDEGEEPVMVHAVMLHLFLSMFNRPDFRSQMSALMETSESIIITGHSIGGTVASLSALWLLSYLQSVFSSKSVLCITFGSPMLGNQSLHNSILREKWGGNFCHVVSKHDIMPRLFFAPLASLAPQLPLLLQYWHFGLNCQQFEELGLQISEELKAGIFRLVMTSLTRVGASAGAEEGVARTSFWPFGNYFFCSEEGAICIDNATSVVNMLYLTLSTGFPNCSIKDHLRYKDYIGKIYLQFLDRRSYMQGILPESSYEAGIALALGTLGLADEESVAIPAKDCLEVAKRMGRAPNILCANLAISLSKITPYRAEIEWFKSLCDESDDQLGYYDTFKLQRHSKRDFKVNMNRLKLASFWNNVIEMFESGKLPHDFYRKPKYVNASQFYKLLVEPLDIAEYYRTDMHKRKGHYIEHGRERRYKILDKWWKERKVGKEKNIRRSRYASLTQDTCFWAKVEEAREWLDSVHSETDNVRLALLWEKIGSFEQYARDIVENKEVSIDVLARNSSYSLWVREYRELKSQDQHFMGF